MMDSPLRHILCDPTKNKALIAEVIPKYLAYFAMKNIMDIDRAKETFRMHEEEKNKFRPPKPKVEVVQEVEEVKKPAKPGKQKVEVVEEIEPRPTDEEPADIKKYGRRWIFVNYFREEEEQMNMMLKGASMLSRVNPDVLVDLDDYIMLEAFSMYKNTT